MSLTAEKIIADAKEVANRLKLFTGHSDAIFSEADHVYETLESLRRVHVDFEVLNQLGRSHTNNQMVHAINQEHPHLRDIQMQNRELRACLQDYQRALEHIMSKYREHTQKKILNSQVSFTYLSQNDARFNNKYIDKIQEMVAVMRLAAQSDDDNYERVGREQDILINKLMTENKGLREMLQISRDFGNVTQTKISRTAIDMASQTDQVHLLSMENCFTGDYEPTVVVIPAVAVPRCSDDEDDDEYSNHMLSRSSSIVADSNNSINNNNVTNNNSINLLKCNDPADNATTTTTTSAASVGTTVEEDAAPQLAKPSPSTPS